MDKRSKKNKKDFDFCIQLFYKDYDGYNIKSIDKTYEYLKNNYEYRFVYERAYEYFCKKVKTYTMTQLVKELKKRHINISRENVFNILVSYNIIYKSESTGKVYGTSLGRDTEYLKYSKNNTNFRYTNKTLKMLINNTK